MAKYKTTSINVGQKDYFSMFDIITCLMKIIPLIDDFYLIWDYEPYGFLGLIKFIALGESKDKSKIMRIDGRVNQFSQPRSCWYSDDNTTVTSVTNKNSDFVLEIAYRHKIILAENS